MVVGGLACRTVLHPVDTVGERGVADAHARNTRLVRTIVYIMNETGFPAHTTGRVHRHQWTRNEKSMFGPLTAVKLTSTGHTTGAIEAAL